MKKYLKIVHNVIQCLLCNSSMFHCLEPLRKGVIKKMAYLVEFWFILESELVECALHGIFVVLLAQGQTQGSMLNNCTNKTPTIDPFDNTCEAGEVSPEVEAGGLQDAGVCNQAGTRFCDKSTSQNILLTLRK
jgi:hypothetical protein